MAVSRKRGLNTCTRPLELFITPSGQSHTSFLLLIAELKVYVLHTIHCFVHMSAVVDAVHDVSENNI